MMPSPSLVKASATQPSAARRVRVFVGVALCALAIASCAKRNAPQAPPDVPDTYPRPYPNE